MKTIALLPSMVLGWWMMSVPLVSAQCNSLPDLVIVNAHIITMNPAQAEASALAIRDGVIQAIGTIDDILALIPEGCPVAWIDAGGYTILPGFNDAHTHWLSWREHLCDAPGQAGTTYPELDVIMDSISLHGWTSISELNFGRPDLIPEHLQNALALDAAGDLHVRLNGYWGTYDDIGLIDVLQDHGYAPGHAFTDRIRAPGVKFYVDDPFGTMDLLDQATVTQLVTTAHQAGYQVAAHCVNVTAMEKILNAYETALGASGNVAIRHRIEHAVKVSDDQLQRMEDKGILASFQLMGPPDWPEQNTFQTYISQSDTDYILRWKDFVGSGVPVVGSTDAPFNNTVCDYSPFRVIYQAVTRKGYLDRTPAGWELAQRISIAEALKLLTVDGAWATHEENVKGSLKPGMYADLTIVTADPLSVTVPEELLDIRSLVTMVGGQNEYCSEDAPALCQPGFAFVVDTMVVIVSQYVPDEKPGMAFDQDLETNWVSGGFAPQYIRLDLLENTTLDRIELDVEQFPEGFTRHQVWGAPDGGSLTATLLHEFSGTTEDHQVLAFDFTAPDDRWRYITVSTIESPSWVAWSEIRLYKEGATAVEGFGPRSIATAIFPNPSTGGFLVELDPGHDLDDVILSFLSMDGRSFARLPLGHLTAGLHQIPVSAQLLEPAGPGNLLMVLRAGNLMSCRMITRL